MVRFAKLGPEGITDVVEIPVSVIRGCPKVILVASHYRSDGTCRCDEIICEWDEGCTYKKSKNEIYCRKHIKELEV